MRVGVTWYQVRRSRAAMQAGTQQRRTDTRAFGTSLLIMAVRALIVALLTVGAVARLSGAPSISRRLIAAHHKTACIACCACKHYTKSNDCGFDKCTHDMGWCWDPERSKNGGYGEYCETTQMYKIGFPACTNAQCKYHPPIDERGWKDIADEQPNAQQDSAGEPVDIDLQH